MTHKHHQRVQFNTACKNANHTTYHPPPPQKKLCFKACNGHCIYNDIIIIFNIDIIIKQISFVNEYQSCYSYVLFRIKRL